VERFPDNPNKPHVIRYASKEDYESASLAKPMPEKIYTTASEYTVRIARGPEKNYREQKKSKSNHNKRNELQS
jgi:hypothetical protein